MGSRKVQHTAKNHMPKGGLTQYPGGGTQALTRWFAHAPFSGHAATGERGRGGILLSPINKIEGGDTYKLTGVIGHQRNS